MLRGFAESPTLEAYIERACDRPAFRKALADQKPVVDALADRVEELEKDVNKLATRLGEARERGKVDVKELLIRAALLKRRQEREAEEAKSAAAKPLTRALKPSGPAAARGSPMRSS